MGPLFGIGSIVRFGEERWKVVRYHRVCGTWEVMFCSEASGVHRSVPCSQLEQFTP